MKKKSDTPASLAHWLLGKITRAEEKLYFVDPDFLALFSTPFIKGQPETALNQPLSVVISEKAARKYFANENPLGKTLHYNNKFDFQVTGIFKNMPKNTHFTYDFLASFQSLRTLQGEDSVYMDRWTSMDFQTYIQLREETDALYQSEKRLNRAVTLFTYIALFLANLGLFGLVMFSVEKRVKEIGVRKVLGARALDIVALLSKDFMRLVLLANLIALPLTYILINKWLQSFAYRIDLSVWIFIVSGLAVLVISLLIVSYQTVKAAMANPVDSLRYE